MVLSFDILIAKVLSMWRIGKGDISTKFYDRKKLVQLSHGALDA